MSLEKISVSDTIEESILKAMTSLNKLRESAFTQAENIEIDQVIQTIKDMASKIDELNDHIEDISNAIYDSDSNLYEAIKGFEK